MRFMAIGTMILAWIVAFSVSAEALDDSLMQTSGEPSIGSGRFYGYRTPSSGPGANAFSNAYNKAVAEGVPLVVIWSDDGCEHCDAFIREVNGSKSAVASWLASKKAVFTFFKDKLTKPTASYAKEKAYHSGAACWDAWNFAANTCGAKASWPLYAFYYKERDVVHTWGTALDSNGSTRTWARFKADFEGWVERHGITDYKGGEFAASGTDFDRYEAEPTTEYVDVELVRDADKGGYAYTNRLEAVWPGESVARATNIVEWAVSETAKTVRVPLAREEGEAFPEGNITLRLFDQNANVRVTTPIVCRASVANSNVNPLWLNERTAETLAWGEWTSDIDVATNKAAAAEGAAYTIVSVQGSLWCPDCANTDRNFLDIEDAAGRNRFNEWAASNKVALVTVDVPNFNGPTYTNYASPSLFNRAAFATAIARAREWPDSGADSMLTNRYLRSGCGYLSRKMATEEEAEAIRIKCHFLTATNTAFGGFHRPEDRNAYRTGIPNFILLRKDGSVAARLTRFDAVSLMAEAKNRWDDVIARFDEMLQLASDATEIDDNHWTTTKSVLSSARPIEASISHVDTADVAEISDASVGAHLKLSLASASANSAKLAILSVKDGVLSTVASVYGALDGLSVEADLTKAADRWFASVSCENTAAGFTVEEPVSTLAPYTLSEECYLQPQDAAATNVPGGRSVIIRVQAGELYRFVGLALPMAGIEKVEGETDVFRATVSGDVTMQLAEGATSVVYQLWHPGRVEFAVGAQTVYTHMGDASLRLVRQGGVSGRLTETVRLLSSEHADGRYVWTNDVDVVWEEGEGGEKSVRLEIVPPGAVMHSLGTLTFGAGDSQLVVRLLDSDSPGLELLDYDACAYRYFSSGISFGTINLLSGSHVSVRVLSGTIPAGTRLAYDEASGEVKLQGEPLSAGDYEFTIALAEIRDGRYVLGPASTIRVAVAETDAINPYLTMARPSETLPLYADRNDTNFVAGTLSVAITSRGKISARYVGTEVRTASFSGSWQNLDEENGTASATLERGGCRLSLAMDAAGELDAWLWVPAEYSCFAAGQAGMLFTASAPWPQADSFSEYKGIYNVVLPSGGASRPDAPSGIGLLVLRMASDSAAAAGRFSYSGFLPDGTPLNGTAKAVRHSEFGGSLIHVPLFRRIGKSCFSAVLAIKPNASENWDSPSDPIAREVAGLATGTMALSLHRDTAWDYEICHETAVGSYYVPDVSPLELSEMFYSYLYGSPVRHKLRFAADGVKSPEFGGLSAPEATVVPGEAALTLESKPLGLLFKFSPRTGMFSGAAVLTFTDERGRRKNVTGSYRGLLTPGWIRNCDCGYTPPEWYFGSGFVRYRDFDDNGRAVIKSVPVTLDPDFE